MRERDLAGRHDLFVAEGEVVVRLLVSGRSRFRPASLLLSEARARASSAWLDRQALGGLPVYVAARRVMDAVVGFPIHRGVLALGRRGPAPEGAGLLPPAASPCLVLGLVGLANHDNVGAAVRNAAAFGADAVLLDGATCDPLYRKAIRVSAGTVLTTPFARLRDADAMVDLLLAQGIGVFALGPAGAEEIGDVPFPERTALLLGAEGPGLSPRLLARLRSVRIGMAPGVDSLNVAAAGAVALHAVRAGRRRSAPEAGGAGD